MAKFVPDIKSNRWVIIAPARVTRPHDNPSFADQNVGAIHESPLQKCPFCPGNEELNKELFVIASHEVAKQSSNGEDCRVVPPAGGTPRNDTNWLIRVIANKYPLTDFHEVIIHSPDHEKDIDELPTAQVELLLNVYRQRYNYHKKGGTVLIFNNHDIHAGASLAHPHSQVVVVPPEISLQDIPKEPVENIVLQTKNFVVYCPAYSEWPYEIWVAPNDVIASHEVAKQSTNVVGAIHESPLRNKKIAASSTVATGTPRNDTTFGSITDDQIHDLAPLLQKILKVVVNRFRLEGRNDTKVGAIHESPLQDIPYNFYISHGENWYLRIIPRFVHRAGFELGTGILVNIIDPKEAAEEYRGGIAQPQ